MDENHDEDELMLRGIVVVVAAAAAAEACGTIILRVEMRYKRLIEWKSSLWSIDF
jgi:hypothetical protein